MRLRVGLGGVKLQVVNEFKYLSSTVYSKGAMEVEEVNYTLKEVARKIG